MKKSKHLGGHIFSEKKYGFIWDEGPHVSFTNNEYVKNLFHQNVNGDLINHKIKTVNYFKGNWVPHPAQVNLHALPEPLRSICFNDLINNTFTSNPSDIKSYYDWLLASFGKTFSDNYQFAIQKILDCSSQKLSVDWIGQRMYRPSLDEVKKGFIKPLDYETHYIQSARYPNHGGYFSFAKKLYAEKNIFKQKEVKKVDLKIKEYHLF